MIPATLRAMDWPKYLLVTASFLVYLAVAQEQGPQPRQVNSTLCYWDSPRAALMRDTFYIDGGELWWMASMADGTLSPVSDDNPRGVVFQLNFSTPFNTTNDFNFTTAFNTNLNKASGGGSANNIFPQYYDGAMFANDYDWITYGGLYLNTDAYQPQPANQFATYQRYPNGPLTFEPGFKLGTLTGDTTRFITNGATASVPSENLGFYFGGLRSNTSGTIFKAPSNTTVTANVQSTTLITADLSDQGREKWSNDTLPPNIPGRANAELVWVPVGEKGILVAIGGVIYPSFATQKKNNASINALSTATSPTFMTTVSVYDIATKVWYQQNTTGEDHPGQLTQGCTVLASAQDGSSHNIYWYGGYDGLDQTGVLSDDVWVLSIPTFAWVKVNSGNSSHGRAGHRCTKPYPDQMVVVGGYPSLSGVSPGCVQGFIQVFNLTTAQWITSYHPDKWFNYGVPASVVSVIGGSATGSATQTKPSPSGFSNSSMIALFNTKYDTSKIKTWYPYHLAPSNDVNSTTILPSAVPKPSNGTPGYLAPVLGVVLGLIFISLLALAIYLWRRKKYFKPNGTATQSEQGTLDNRRWVTNWLRNSSSPVPVNEKAPTVTTDDTHVPLEYEQERAYLPEVGGTQIVEMADTSRPTELSGGFVPLSTNKTSRGHGTHRSPSTGSHISHTSSVSRESNGSNVRPSISPIPTPRADSPPVGTPVGELPDRQRGFSVISNVSESDRGHLRGISETSVSTDGGVYATPMGIPELEEGGAKATGGARPSAVSPLTPPMAIQEGSDYIGAGSGVSSSGRLGAADTVRGSASVSGNRKSMFEENLDDEK
ncbi:hypothetical protein HYFRA_00002419 [Hymenoscyphus fraxineus]|uniref:Kelch repeat protein n=1 Tax=Hymenoscyphus fraxineus TaxID=746836 RepID=A0A9N9LCD5_9HELO|nr:hypothetical protein HYFRA_00002419 [Hymenoscyphus fraxineus]